MTGDHLHPDEVVAGLDMAASLVARQFPRWAGYRPTRVESSGTDNVMYRLGDELVARFPRTAAAARDVDKEQRLLPRLAPNLPVAVPDPVGRGEPDAGYPWHWSVYRWLDGTDASVATINDHHRFADDLAAFVNALHGVDAAVDRDSGDAPRSYRCDPLAWRNDATREAIESCRSLAGLDVDLGVVSEIWDTVVSLRDGYLPECWIHADLMATNLLVADGRLTAVIDFGGLAVGNPTVEYAVAWGLLPSSARPTFRAAVGVDDDTWARSMGWALSLSLITLPYYWETNRRLVELSLARIAAVVDGWRSWSS